MKIQYILLLCICIAACKKKVRTVTYTCNTPAIMLYNQQYSNSQWDTIITMVFDKGYKQPMIIDTFVALHNAHQLQINHDMSNPKDYIIYLPSVSKTYKLYDVTVNVKRVDAPEDSKPNCYHDIDFTLDSQRITNADFSGGKAYFELKK